MKNESKQVYRSGQKSGGEKQPPLPNECGLKRWIIIAALILFCMVFVAAVVDALVKAVLIIPEGPFTYLPDYLGTMLGFAVIYALAVFFIRKIGKTSFRDFVFGSRGKLNIKLCITIAVLYLIGFFIVVGPSVVNGELALYPAGPVPVLVNLVLCLALVWMQTTVEEILFRGVFLRAACGDDLRFSVRSVAASVVASLLFMAMHLANPEVLGRSGLELVVFSASYFVMGFLMCLFDVYFGSLLPGIIFHLVNNFFCLAILNYENTVMPTASLFLAVGEASGGAALLSEFLMNTPMILYVIFLEVRRRKASARRS